MTGTGHGTFLRALDRDSHPVMANTSISYLQGDCIAPFLDASRFPDQGGFVGGRFCAPISGLPHNPTCCIPCPATEWAYPNSFTTYTTVAEWLNVIGLILMIFMLLSYLVLPAQKTRSHYLSVCLIVSVMMIAIGFTVPLSAQPEQCYNEITPNDMFTSNECAWSGAFIIAGGLCATMWIFIRALSMNLQICWDIVPGRKFFYGAQAVGWGIPAVLFTATLTVTGVSFRFGNACHVNHKDSMKDFWGPLMAFAGLAGLLQLVTCVYCIHVYLKNLFNDETQTTTTGSDHLPSYSSSVRTQTARAVYVRLKKVLWLQWRGISIVSIILVDVVFFSVVFVYLDDLQESVTSDWRKVEPWLTCLAMNPTDKDKCVNLVHGWLVNESTVAAVLMLLSLTGIQIFLFLTRPSVFPAWVEYFRSRTSGHNEFVSLDARPDVMRSHSRQELIRYERGHEKTTFEMQKPMHHLDLESKTMSPTLTDLSSPDDIYRSPITAGHSTPPLNLDPRRSIASSLDQRSTVPLDYVSRQTTRSPSADLASPPTPVVRYDAISLHRQDSDYFMQRATSNGSARSADRRYQAPNSSFSVPKTPSRQSSLRSVGFEAQQHTGSNTVGNSSSNNGYSSNLFPYGRHNGLALNPPSEKGESQEDLSVYSRDSREPSGNFDRRG